MEVAKFLQILTGMEKTETRRIVASLPLSLIHIYGVVIAANYWGKFKTVSQMAMIIVLIADFGGVFDMVGTVLIWIATALTVISLVDYVWANREVLTKGGM